MNYIGSKRRLLSFIYQSINNTWKGKRGTFCDLFAGTGVVAEKFKREGWRVEANDLQYYSVVRLHHILLNNSEPQFKNLPENIFSGSGRKEELLAYLNRLKGKDGFIYQNFCPGGTKNKEYQRQYFSDNNGRRCDAIRQQIEAWRQNGLLEEGEYYYLLASLLEAVDARANTASVYGAFLKSFKKSALEDLDLVGLPIVPGAKGNRVYQEEANDLLKKTSGDVLYLDPPYNQRQYGANYHLLETIARYDYPELRGKTGLRDWSDQRSPWCSKSTVTDAFQELLQRAQYSVIALSYNDEGLMSFGEIKKLMSHFGSYTMHRKKYSRFRADQKGARNHKRDFVYEYLHILEKR